MKFQRFFQRKLFDQFDIRRGITDMPVHGIGFDGGAGMFKNNFSFRGREVPRQYFQQRGFSGPVRAEYSVPFARPESIVQPPEYPVEAKPLAGVLQKPA